MRYITFKPVIFGIIIIAAALLVYNAFQTPVEPPLLGDVHIHADFKVFINGEALNFSQAKYMSTNSTKLSYFVHSHDGDGEVIHVHMSDVTLGQFFNSLNMSLNSSCFYTGEETVCTAGNKALKMYVNGVENSQFDSYVVKDLDRVLVTYGNGSNLAQELAAVTDNACIQSETCPERGKPHDESSCLTGSECQV